MAGVQQFQRIKQVAMHLTALIESRDIDRRTSFCKLKIIVLQLPLV